MSTLIVAAILIAGTILISVIFININKKNERKRRESLLSQFSKAGSERGLSFSAQEVLKNKIVGLDGLQRKLMVYEFSTSNVTVIDVGAIKNCSVKKGYESLNIGTGKKSKVENYLTSIVIQFQFIGNADPISVSFYDSACNSIYEMAELEAKAKDWVTVLSKMLVKEHRTLA
jgi:hypothetical protein